MAELAGEGALTSPVFWQAEKRGRDRADKPEYKVKLSVACCFSNKVQIIEHYHNSSWLEHGGAPEKAAKCAFVSASRQVPAGPGQVSEEREQDHLAGH